MLKSPEEYLAGLSFDPPEPANHTLTSGERIFVEKYLGLEALDLLPEVLTEQAHSGPALKFAEPFKTIE